jgi:D-beta-D-heptose 7-phosphate kinase/D-beta-D-heptose 1-phosphate adenosyltransferase
MSAPRRLARDKVTNLAQLLETLRPLREDGRSVVFTNGCYDLLHVGHLELLESAAQLGDLLVVGLNGDASVRRLKGQARPLVPFDERATMVAGLEAVDWVVGFDEDTPERLIRELLPDVLVKGGDWAPDEIVGRETVERNGGRVVTIPLIAGRSTTAIVERIMRARHDRPS